MHNILLSSLTILITWYILGGIYVIKKQGLDPTLLIIINPFYLSRYRVIWVTNILVFLMLLLDTKLTLFLGLTVFLFSLTQLLLLVVFERTGTQPVLVYLLLTLESFSFVLLPYKYAWILFFSLIEIIALVKWSNRRVDIYNKWVQKKVAIIDRKYRNVNSELSKEEWFYTLHFAVTEGIARPWLTRQLEKIYFYVKKPKFITSGIMQVRSDKLLSNSESIFLGSNIIKQSLELMPKDLIDPNKQLRWLAKQYNGSINEKTNLDYTEYLLSTYPGLVLAWNNISVE